MPLSKRIMLYRCNEVYGNQCTLRKPLACYKSQDDRGVSKYTLPHVGNECTTLG